jgi:chromosome segregation ATPase
LPRLQPPIGPLGAFMSLTDDRWKTAAESVLGAHLNKWIVTSRRDEQVRLSLRPCDARGRACGAGALP